MVALVAGLLAVAGLAVLGGAGLFRPSTYRLAITLPAATPSPAKIASTPPAPPCWYNTTPAKAQYNTADAAVVKNDDFGPSLAPKSLPAVPLKGYVAPRSLVRSVVCAEWRALRTRPNQALATVTVMFPQLRSYYGASQVTQLGMLSDHGDWTEARLVFVGAESLPPHQYTMGMNYQARPKAPPVFITYARATGWYLTVPFGNTTLYLRIACGGQPSFDMRGERYRALLVQDYPLG